MYNNNDNGDNDNCSHDWNDSNSDNHTADNNTNNFGIDILIMVHFIFNVILYTFYIVNLSSTHYVLIWIRKTLLYALFKKIK